MNRILKGLLASAAVAGVSYYMRNRRLSSSTTAADEAVDRGVPIYDNHVVTE